MQLTLTVCFILIVLSTSFPIGSLHLTSAMSLPRKLSAGLKYPTLQLRGSSSLAITPLHNLRAGYFVDKRIGLSSVLISPAQLYNFCLLAMVGLVLSSKFGTIRKSFCTDSNAEKKPSVVKDLQAKFLTVFWLLRMADWLQGPYFFEVFSSKTFNGTPVSSDMIGKVFLVGFATTGLIGPFLGQLVDTYGRKGGTLLYTLLYALSALSTRSSHLAVILAGRIAGGLGTSLLFSAPEAWLVGEHERSGMENKWLGQTFGWAYAGDAMVAIIAGQLATLAARRAGPTGPFLLSVAFLAMGALGAMWKWDENTAHSLVHSAPVLQKQGQVANATEQNEEKETSQPSINAALRAIVDDKRILLLGVVQAMFEGAMYLFVLQWPPLIAAAIQTSHFGPDAVVPYGLVFSCFMASCLLGSTFYSKLQEVGVVKEKSMTIMLAVAALALATAAQIGSTHLIGLSLAFFVFETCVGMYFPSIGSLRSKYLPDQHRAVMMNLFGIPLNLMVVSIVLGLKYLGPKGALGIASAALAVATLCMARLNAEADKEQTKHLF